MRRQSTSILFPFAFRPDERKTCSQSCAVVKSEQFWRATGQSNLADRMEDCCTGERAVVWVQKHWKLLLQPAVRTSSMNLCCGPTEFLTYSYCAWLWNWRSITGFWGPFSDFQILYTLQAGVGQFPSRSLHAHLYWWSGTRRRARGHNSGSGPSEAHRSAGSCGGPEATGTYTQVSYCQEVWVWWVISDRWVKRIGLVNSDLCQW